MKLQTLFTKVGRTVQITLTALVVGGALLVAPTHAAHAGGPDFSVLVGGNQGKGEVCPDWSKNQAGVYIYSDVNYQGRCAYFVPKVSIHAFNLDAVKRTLGNDAASSIRVRNASNTRFIVDFYKDKDWQGQIAGFVSDDADIRHWTYPDGSNMNDTLSSLIVYMGAK